MGRFRSFAELISQLRNLRMKEVKDGMQRFNEATGGANRSRGKHTHLIGDRICPQEFSRSNYTSLSLFCCISFRDLGCDFGLVCWLNCLGTGKDTYVYLHVYA